MGADAGITGVKTNEWTKFSGIGSLSAGKGLLKTGSTIDILPNTN